MIRRAALVVALWLAVAVPTQAAGWDDFQIIMWADQTPAQMQALKRLGINNLRVTGTRDAPLDPTAIAAKLAPLRAAGMGFYLENIATDFYAPYHRYLPDHPGQPNWLFEQARALYRANPADRAALRRDPSLSDPVWQSRIRARLAAHVRAYGQYRPLFYNLADEPGIADLAAPWDFDFSRPGITAFRQAMQANYGTLERLNYQWDTNFTDWDAVMPDTTSEAMARKTGNVSAWMDFRAWMDLSFAQALRMGTEAAHAGGPGALAGIEGAQVPGSGGYDYALLPYAVDVIEGDEDGAGLAIARSVNPSLITLATTAGSGPAEATRIWRSLLAGIKGLVVWDGDNSFTAADGSPSQRAKDLAPLFAELTGGLASQLMAASPITEKVAILYSPPSQRLRWLLDRQPKGEAWRDAANLSEAEALDDHLARKTLVRASLALTHMGVQPRYLTPTLLARGVLRDSTVRLLILPQTLALSAREADEISAFATAGGMVVADAVPGQYDEHGHPRATLPLAAMIRRGKLGSLPQAMLDDPTASSLPAITATNGLLTQSGAKPDFRLLTPAGRPARDVELRLYRNGDVVLVALQRSPVAAGQPALQGDEKVELVVTPGTTIFDLRRRVALEHTAKLSLMLPPDSPTLLAISAGPLPAPVISGVRTILAPGSTTDLTVALNGLPTTTIHVLHGELLDPADIAQPGSAINLRLSDTTVPWTVRLPENAQPGKWNVQVTDILTGAVARMALEVRAPRPGCPHRRHHCMKQASSNASRGRRAYAAPGSPWPRLIRKLVFQPRLEKNSSSTFSLSKPDIGPTSSPRLRAAIMR